MFRNFFSKIPLVRRLVKPAQNITQLSTDKTEFHASAYDLPRLVHNHNTANSELAMYKNFYHTHVCHLALNIDFGAYLKNYCQRPDLAALVNRNNVKQTNSRNYTQHSNLPAVSSVSSSGAKIANLAGARYVVASLKAPIMRRFPLTLMQKHQKDLIAQELPQNNTVSHSLHRSVVMPLLSLGTVMSNAQNQNINEQPQVAASKDKKIVPAWQFEGGSCVPAPQDENIVNDFDFEVTGLISPPIPK